MPVYVLWTAQQDLLIACIAEHLWYGIKLQDIAFVQSVKPSEFRDVPSATF